MMKRTLLALTIALSTATAHAEEVSLIVKEHGSDTYKEIIVDSSQVEMVKNSGDYVSVEENEWVTIPSRPSSDYSKSGYQPRAMAKDMFSAQSSATPNDPEYSWQYYFHPQSETEGSSEIQAGIDASEQNKRLTIAVIDGGFNNAQDINWNSDKGYNFYQAFGQVINPEWRSGEDPNDCETGHGNAVGGIIGAESNNGVGIAGVIDADMVPIRAFECNMARLNDVADAIRYAAGGQVGDAPVIDPVDIVNLSMGGPREECPAYLQDAIDFANSQGTAIYVAAGNQGVDINGIVPAKCEGVIVVGASDQQRVRTDFSNYGSLVDFMIAGYDVMSYNFEDTVGWWEGTSFATPLAVAVHGLALQHAPDLTHEEIVSFMKATSDEMSTDISAEYQDCSDDQCGSGLINAEKLMTYVDAISSGDSYTIRHALSEESTCDQELFMTHIGNAVRLCEMYEVVIDPTGEQLNNNVKFVRVTKGESLIQENVELITETNQTVILVDDIDSESYDYGVQICLDDECTSSPIIKVEVDETTVPAICD